MKESIISKREEGITLIAYLQRILPQAGRSFLYKMLRKKNILLNQKKAEGNEALSAGDTIQVYFSDDTYDKFTGKDVHTEAIQQVCDARSTSAKQHKTLSIDIVYEDEDILIVNKPSGVLSQKAKPEDYSLNDWLLTYLKEAGADDTFTPSVCNRLDRNTSGIVLCSKSLKGARYLSAILKDRSLHKYYLTIVIGNVMHEMDLHAYLTKNVKTNQVSIHSGHIPGASEIHTSLRPLAYDAEKKLTLCEICLHTGKSHQIRAHLSHIGFPILGDEKYGKHKVNLRYRDTHHVYAQLLHAYRLEFPEDSSAYHGFRIQIGMPKLYAEVMKDAEWLHGIPEDFVDQPSKT